MGLLQRGLHQILGVAAVAGQQIGGPQQRPPLPLDERPEVVLVFRWHAQ